MDIGVIVLTAAGTSVVVSAVWGYFLNKIQGQHFEEMHQANKEIYRANTKIHSLTERMKRVGTRND